MQKAARPSRNLQFAHPLNWAPSAGLQGEVLGQDQQSNAFWVG